MSTDTTFTPCPSSCPQPGNPQALWGGQGEQGRAGPAQVRGRCIICHPYLLLLYTELPVNSSLKSHLTRVRRAK